MLQVLDGCLTSFRIVSQDQALHSLAGCVRLEHLSESVEPLSPREEEPYGHIPLWNLDKLFDAIPISRLSMQPNLSKMSSALTRQRGALEKLVASRPEAMKDMQEERLDAETRLC